MFSINTYNGTGIASPYVVTFPYLSKDHVEVRIGGVLQTSGFSWINSSTLSILAPVGTLNVEIKRNTPKEIPEVTFIDGSPVISDEMNLETLQLMYITQEAYDNVAASAAATLVSADAAARAYADAHDLVTLAAAAVEAANLVNSISPPVFQGWFPTILADGPDYTSGTSTSVTLPDAPSTGERTIMAVIFDGLVQNDFTLDEDNVTLSFGSAIPAGVKKITVWYAAAFNLGAFVQTGVGVYPRSYQEKLRDVVSVKDFWAKGDGVTDDTVAFQSAVNCARKVIVPAGEWVTGQIVIPTDTVIVGEGNCTVIKPRPGFSTNAFWVTASGASHVEIGNLYMNFPVADFLGTVPIYVQDGSNNRIHDVYMPEGGNIGLVLVDNVDTVVERVTVLAANVYCMQSNGTASARNKFDKCHAGTTLQSHGISIVDGVDHTVTNCISEGASGFGISYFRVTGGQATHNRCGNTKVEGMQITDSNYVTYANNNVRWDVPGVSHDFGISMAAQTPGLSCIGNKIINNFISGNGASGIGIASTNFGPLNDAPIPGPGLPVQDNDISGNTIINCSLNTVAGGGLVNGYGAGILLYGSGCQDNSISNNIILNNQGTMLYAIAEFDVSNAWGPPNGNKIFSNKCIGFTTAALLNVGNSVVSFTSGTLPYSATLGSVSGSLTSANVVNAFYYETETTYDVMIQIHITTNGSASGGITFTLPRFAQIGFGCGHNSGGGTLGVTCSGATATIRNADGTHPGADGQTLEVMCRFFR